MFRLRVCYLQQRAPVVEHKPTIAIGKHVVLLQLALLIGPLNAGERERAVPRIGYLAGRWVIQAEKAVAYNGIVLTAAGIHDRAVAEVRARHAHHRAAAPGQLLLVDAQDIAVHQGRKAGLLRFVAVGIDIGNIVGLNVQTLLLLLSAHGGRVK